MKISFRNAFKNNLFLFDLLAYKNLLEAYKNLQKPTKTYKNLQKPTKTYWKPTKTYWKLIFESECI
jgi:hypothetical protein